MLRPLHCSIGEEFPFPSPLCSQSAGPEGLMLNISFLYLARIALNTTGFLKDNLREFFYSVWLSEFILEPTSKKKVGMNNLQGNQLAQFSRWNGAVSWFCEGCSRGT
ncbi:uncharacterized protein LOC124675739 [Lolium rigidum]|uniref:uncharacterized protein LOC124675739 n=1 Tax=Lolium rigidum TaxID=89674 RepID=UPI001F5C41FB|nr:uncharacterized protein LOC124675739 [Lolium rigidum]